MDSKINKCEECVYLKTHLDDAPCVGCSAEGNAFVPHSVPNKDIEARRLQHTESTSGKALDTQVGGGHYKDFKIQPVEFIVANDIPYREANVIKYTTRHKDKNGIEDVRKAIHYLQMIVDDYVEGNL